MLVVTTDSELISDPFLTFLFPSPELSVKTGPHAPLCETTKSGFDLRVQETDGEQLARAVARLECR